MKKVLILGGGGMLGHKVYQTLSRSCETWVTFRNFDNKLRLLNMFNELNVINNIDVFNIDDVKNAISTVKPDIVINCVGIIKQLKESKNPKISVYVNSLFPHLVSEICLEKAVRFIHISTDCVFSGKRGMYTETDLSDAEDLYGKTKFIGEVNYAPGLTLRTSIIGHELFTNVSLVDWFLSNSGKTVNGYTNAIYTGFPTVFFAREIERVITAHPSLTGLYQVSSIPISKYDLLQLIKKTYQLDIEIIADTAFKNDKSLICDRYMQATGFKTPHWSELIEEMHADFISTNYQGWTNV